MNVSIDNMTKETFDFRGYKKLIENVIETVAQDKGIPKDLDVDVLIVEPAFIKKINKENRGIDKVTDVLSFPYFEFSKPGQFPEDIYLCNESILGDIIICADKVVSQAISFGHSQKRELAFLTLHSMLHLLGYDHIKKSDEYEMQKEAERFMELLGIPR